MERYEVCQACLDLFQAPRYLEIGVQAGVTFDRIRAAEKVAVDPLFRFDIEEAARRAPECRYHPVDSDTYFRDIADGRFDVVFIDGLHNLEQTLRDLMNSLMFIDPASILIVDDVIPNGYAASISDRDTFRKVLAAGEGDGAWMGDVYRLAHFIAAFMPMWSYRTVVENHGQLVMWRERRDVRSMSLEAVSRVSYADVVLDKSVFRLTPLEEILALIKTSRTSA